MRPSEALRVVDKLKAAYPRQVIGADTLQVYAEALADLDADLLRRIAQEHILSERWFPTIAELRERAAEIVCDLPPTCEVVAVLHGNATAHPLIQKALTESLGRTWSYDYGRSERPGLLRKQATEHYGLLRRVIIRELQANPGQMLKYIEAHRQRELEGGAV